MVCATRINEDGGGWVGESDFPRGLWAGLRVARAGNGTVDRTDLVLKDPQSQAWYQHLCRSASSVNQRIAFPGYAKFFLHRSYGGFSEWNTWCFWTTAPCGEVLVWERPFGKGSFNGTTLTIRKWIALKWEKDSIDGFIRKFLVNRRIWTYPLRVSFDIFFI